jgi:hypothetical protein
MNTLPLTEEDIKTLITSSPEFAINCLKELNKKNAFTKFDSEILTSFAKQVIAWDSEPTPHRFNTPLSVKQLKVLYNRLPKYSKTLSKILE